MQIDTEEVYGDMRSESQWRLFSWKPIEVALRGPAHWRGDLACGRVKVADGAVAFST
jgi:hypothetical protein